MKHLILLFASILVTTTSIFAIQTISGGDYTSAAIWTGSDIADASGETAEIQSGDSVYLLANFNYAARITVESGGILFIDGDLNIQEASQSIVVNSGGKLYISGSISTGAFNSNIINNGFLKVYTNVTIDAGSITTDANTTTLIGGDLFINSGTGSYTTGIMTITNTINIDGAGVEFHLKAAGTLNLGNPMNETNGGAFINEGGTLPVEIITYYAKFNGHSIDVIWETGSEKDNAYFILEYSPDGFEYDEIARINGNGNSITKQSYSFNHEDIQYGANYYRIIQVDYNNDRYYKDVIVEDVCTAKGSEPIIGFKNSQIIICNSKDYTDLKIVSIRGEGIATKKLDGKKAVVDLNVQNGVYIVYLISPTNIFSETILVK